MQLQAVRVFGTSFINSSSNVLTNIFLSPTEIEIVMNLDVYHEYFDKESLETKKNVNQIPTKVIIDNHERHADQTKQ